MIQIKEFSDFVVIVIDDIYVIKHKNKFLEELKKHDFILEDK